MEAFPSHRNSFLPDKKDHIDEKRCDPDDSAGTGDGAWRAWIPEVDAKYSDGKRKEDHDGEVAREDMR